MIPESLHTRENRAILTFLSGSSCHSDLALRLYEATEHLEDASEHCTDVQNYGFVVHETQGVIFAAAWGMQEIGFRLDAKRVRIALETGVRAVPEIGPEWVAFAPFRAGAPAMDLAFWATCAYRFAQGEDPS
ncbi:MAG: hypothetical protein AAF170_02740 [Bacteroidota bacterium]